MRRFLVNNLVNISVALAALLAIGVGLILFWQALQAEITAERMQRANLAARQLLHSTALQAKERGLTAAALGGILPPDQLQELTQLRRQVDASWQQALARAEEFAVDAAEHTPLYAYRQRVIVNVQELQRARQRIDGGLATGQYPIGLDEWLGASSELIAAGGSLSERLLLFVQMPKAAALDDISLRHLTWELSEKTGQVRGVLSYYSASGKPIPAAHINQIEAARTRGEEILDELHWLLKEPGSDAHLQRRLEALDELFSTFFSQQLQLMLDAAAIGRYPMGGLEWYRLSTAQIDEIVTFTETVSELSVQRLQQEVRRKSQAVIGFMLFILLGGGLALLSLLQIRRRAAELYLQRELAEITLQSIGDAVITTDIDCRIEYLNPVAEAVTGWRMAEARGRLVQEVFRVENTLHASLVDPVGTCLREGRVVGLTSGHVLIQRDGNKVSVEDSCAPIRTADAAVVGCVIVFYTTGSARNPDHLLSYHSTRDHLTGLINRSEFDRRLQELQVHARTNNEHHVLAYIDLDQFKVVNDTCGHSAGDRMLRQITFLLRKRIRESDTLARLGGDEFALLLHSCPLDRAVSILDELRRTLRDFRFAWEGKVFEVSMSIGAVPITPCSSSPAELLSEADAACYAAKEKGRNRLQVFQPDDLELSLRKGQMNWVTRITDALQADRLELYCQRILPLRAALPERREILVRMRNVDGELVPPMAFIPAAERFNLMPEVDRWVIRNTCAALTAFVKEDADTIFNINLSGLSLSDKNLAAFILNTTREAKIPPHRLCFEITETAAINSLDTMLTLAQELLAHGFAFSLDDFGSGLSSFTYLKTLPVQQIKIDGSFVLNMLQAPLDHTMVRAVIDIGHILDISVCAESVENKATLDQLRRMGVDYAQGYGVERPRPLREFLAAANECIEV